MPRKATTKDVALAAGVSLSAVSQAFRGYGRMKESTKEKIFSVAKEIGYRPNLLVNSFSTGLTKTIGVMMPIRDMPGVEMFAGIEEALSERDNVPIVISTHKNTTEEQQLHRLLERRVDGIILRPMDDACYEEQLQELTKFDVPLVIIDSQIAEEKFSPCFVGTDDIQGGILAAEHLLDLGHRKLGVFTVGNYPKPMYFREKGFKEEVSKCTDATVVTISTNLSDPMHEARKILTQEPTAIFCTLDPLLPYLYKAAQENGISIPRDVSLVGYSGNRFLKYLHPRATTLAQPFERIGAKAVELLFKQIHHQDIDERQVRFEPELMMAESTIPLA